MIFIFKLKYFLSKKFENNMMPEDSYSCYLQQILGKGHRIPPFSWELQGPWWSEFSGSYYILAKHLRHFKKSVKILAVYFCDPFIVSGEHTFSSSSWRRSLIPMDKGMETIYIYRCVCVCNIGILQLLLVKEH